MAKRPTNNRITAARVAAIREMIWHLACDLGEVARELEARGETEAAAAVRASGVAACGAHGHLDDAGMILDPAEEG